MSKELHPNTEIDPPKIEFPCLYPIKIIGVASTEFQAEVVTVVERHAGKISSDLIELQVSKKNTYVSVNYHSRNRRRSIAESIRRAEDSRKCEDGLVR